MSEEELHNQKQLKILEFSLKERQTGTFELIFFDTNHYKDIIFEKVCQQTPQYKHIQLDVGPYEITSLHRHLKENLPTEILQAKQINHIVHIFNLSSSFVTYIKEQDVLFPSQMLKQLNFERELLFRDFPFVILVWLHFTFKLTFAREAPDLSDWITYTFEFKTPPSERIFQGEAFSAPIPEISAASLQRIQNLQERIHMTNQNFAKNKHLLEKRSLYNLLAREYIETKSHKKAIEVYDKILELEQLIGGNPRFTVEILLKIGESNLALGNFQVAEQYFKQVLDSKLDEFISSTYLQMGKVYYQMKQFELAISCLQKAKEIYKKNPDLSQEAEAELITGMILHKQMNSANALHHYQVALEHFKKENNLLKVKKIYLRIALLYYEQGNLELSELFAQKAHKIK